jgi:5-methylthioadenosine/S-adenosylhomocysteine deaminase
MADRPQPVDLLVSGADLVTMDPSRSVILGGAVAIAGGRIAWIGPESEATGRFAPGETVNAPGRIALPGLIDTHFHTGQQLLRGKIIELSRRRQLRLPIWRNYLIPFESILTPDDVYLSGLVAYTNMLRVGTTCFAEAGGPHPDEMGRAAEQLGIRGILALSTVDMGEDIPASMLLSTRQAIDQNVALVKRWHRKQDADRRVQAWLSLRQLIVCTQELWETFRDLAAELDVRIHTHLAEGTYEVEYAAERWGKRPAEHLEAIGFLGPRMHAAHSILLSDGELDLYGRRGVTVAHCPMGNFIIGPPRVPDMVRRGIAVGIGSDGAANGSIDLFRAMHVSQVALQSHFGTPWHVRSVFTPEDLLAMATNGGAQALGLGSELGSLEVGKRADLVLVDPTRIDLQPVYDPMFTAARGVTGSDVETVIVAGRTVMKDRRLLTVDEDELRSRLNGQWPAIMDRFERLVA